MIRNDFVSNSSSSSYIIALDKNECNLDEFIDVVCKRTVDPIHEHLIPDLYDINKTNLKFNIRNNTLLFLGDLCTDRNKEDIVLTPYTPEDECMWSFDKIKREINDLIDSNYTPKKLFPYNEEIHNYDIMFCGDLYKLVNDDTILFKMLNNHCNICIDNSQLQYHLNLDELFTTYLLPIINNQYNKNIDRTIHNIILDNVIGNIYSITKETIEFSEFLTKNKYPKLYYFIDNRIERYKKLLQDGYLIFHIHVHGEGDGMDKNAIYTQNSISTIFKDIDCIKILDTNYS